MDGIFFSLGGNSNISFLNKFSGDLKAEFFLPNVVDTYIKNKSVKVKILNSNDAWFGITYKEDKERVRKKIFIQLEELVREQLESM